MRILIVDDEPLARARLRALLDECQSAAGSPWTVAEAADAVRAMDALVHQPWDVVLLDIHMPGLDGLSLVQRVRQQHLSCAIVFVTADDQHAVTAFELEAVDYLTKPVRKERLARALDRVRQQAVLASPPLAQTLPPDGLLIHERGGMVRIPLTDIVYLKAELKYVTVRTPAKTHLYDGSLQELAQAHPARWLRVHRNALVARHRIRALEKASIHHHDGDVWQVRLEGVDEPLAVSRRQLAAVREALQQGAC